MEQEYLEKENYVTIHADPEIWKHHANYHILNAYKDFIHGYVADFGCNHGACTLLLLENPNVTKLCGIDMNEKALEVAFKLASDMTPQIPIRFIISSLLNIPVENEIYDTIVSFHTLEHIYPKDAESFVREVYRTLKNDGKFLISIPYDRAYPDPAHVAFYKEESLCDLFERNGFKTLECIEDNRWNEKNLLTALFMKTSA